MFSKREEVIIKILMELYRATKVTHLTPFPHAPASVVVLPKAIGVLL